MYEKLRDT